MLNKCTAVLKELVLPITLAVFLAAFFRPAYMKDGVPDYFILWILVGFPFGIRRMWLWLIPRGYDLSGTLGVIGLNVIVGGIIGGFVLVFQVIKGFITLVRCFKK